MKANMKNNYQNRGDHFAIEIKHRKSPNTWALVDKEDFALVSSIPGRWGSKLYPQDHNEYVRWNRVGKRDLFIHRLIMQTPEGLQVDHLNHNGLDNRRANLRNVTIKENLANCVDHRFGGPRIYGATWKRGYSVSWRPLHKRWAVWLSTVVKLGLPRLWLGQYKTKEEAEAVGLAAAKARRLQYGLPDPDSVPK